MPSCGSCAWNNFFWGWWDFVTALAKKPLDHSQELEEDTAVIRGSAKKLGSLDISSSDVNGSVAK